MKKTLFVALAATVALLATSCKKGEAPKAMFSYEVNEMTVTFTNLSKNADSYKWEFGDGKTSDATSPVYTYEKVGTYNVTLTATNKDGSNMYTETIIMKGADIVIDGKFEDWAALEAAGKCQTSKLPELGEGEEYNKTELYKTCWYTDADFIYMYFEYNAKTVAPLDVLISTEMIVDPEAATHLWSPCYADYDLEFGQEAEPTDWTKWSVNFLYPQDHTQGGWNFDTKNPKAENLVTLVKTEDGKMEGRMSRAYFEFKDNYFLVGVFTSDADWKENGTLPCAVMVEGAVSEYPEMLKVNLNN